MTSPMMTTDDNTEAATQAQLLFESCREEPPLQPELEEYDLALPTAGMKKELQAMWEFVVDDEVHNTGGNTTPGRRLLQGDCQAPQNSTHRAPVLPRRWEHYNVFEGVASRPAPA